MSDKRATPGPDSDSYTRRTLSGHFTQIENRFIRGYRHLGLAVKMTYIVIRSYAWNGGTFVSQECLARDCGVTQRTIRRHIQILEDEGLIEVRSRGAHLTNAMTTPELPE